MGTRNQKQRIVKRQTIANRVRRSAHGGWGAPSKMPGLSYGLPAAECKVGSALRKVAGSTCSGCYAFKGKYRERTVQGAQYRRLEALKADIVGWQVSFIRDLRAQAPSVAEADRYFRWHDSGDLQSRAHLIAIINIARACPEWRFWLPTRESGIVRSVLRYMDCPENLTVRVSAAKVDGKAPNFPQTSTVTTDEAQRTCPAPDQGNKCADCRACWDRNVANVAYHLH